MTSPSSTERFTDRVADYVRFRPDYPAALVDFLHGPCAVAPTAPVADIGAGTGISTRMLLDAGHPVVAVEPNAAMRAAADAWLGGLPGYRSVAGTAEATTLESGSVGLVTAAQAFHWFDQDKTRQEFARVLAPGGQVALFWNSRLLEGSAFLRDYEALLRHYCPDYATVAERYPSDEEMATWFRGGLRHQARIPHSQRLDYEALRGRHLSSSFVPKEGHPIHAPMMEALRELFERDSEGGQVVFAYDTRIFVGTVG
ncbi:methyltransferase [Cystobacter fuscus]|uniref:Methyltransferase n=1 Tax=Cystobacter fuscus TaxID=43 RepID=A0A250IWS1_9BACT|nr:class I SAM-dependent methyltransferase [Cystobacter fuscus]ATB35611.1 methyltransferase [Cystobacter fuscus]